MFAKEQAYAALILPDLQGLEAESSASASTRVLTKASPGNRAERFATDDGAIVLCGQWAIRISVQPDSDYGPRILLEPLDRDGGEVPEDVASRLLSDIVLETLADSPADIIEWYAPETLIGRDDFIKLRRFVDVDFTDLTDLIAEDLPEFEDGPFPEVSEDLDDPTQIKRRLDRLQAELAAIDGPALRIGAASWMMTAVLAIVALPVAAALAVVGLVRGMDFRLASQVMSVTMLFAALENTDSLNRVLNQILH
ncbi:hypothetical protein KUH32_16565 [Thalassococcus sp. CAU 1522]|uniref:Uncharacterized protein n=1 Tax=Thalassococcus arenae TaxID=2851652 RepID=A0ABS6NBH3_9RHOB|nr:hypothetical protein [Thalassococcus arenae]MBV2361379.1 hypothetical protein [Thalassococcus arenae]